MGAGNINKRTKAEMTSKYSSASGEVSSGGGRRRNADLQKCRCAEFTSTFQRPGTELPFLLEAVILLHHGTSNAITNHASMLGGREDQRHSPERLLHFGLHLCRRGTGVAE